ncbi:MAG TPA: hypothetical protein HPP87_03790 [Planctomycetes bacterium]|nr:hypothetical protein [Planctomycetota bacterium]
MRISKVSIAVLVLVIIASASATVKDDKAERGEKAPLSVQPATDKSPEEPGRRKRVSPEEIISQRRRDREEMARGVLHAEQLRKLDEQIEEKRGLHNRLIGELNAIKELALQEKAENTANRLEELIEKRTNQFDEEISKLEQRRDTIREQVEKQAKERLKRRERLMERRRQEQEKTTQQGKQGEGKAEGRGRTKRKSKGGTEF